MGIFTQITVNISYALLSRVSPRAGLSFPGRNTPRTTSGPLVFDCLGSSCLVEPGDPLLGKRQHPSRHWLRPRLLTRVIWVRMRLESPDFLGVLVRPLPVLPPLAGVVPMPAPEIGDGHDFSADGVREFASGLLTVAILTADPEVHWVTHAPLTEWQIHNCWTTLERPV